MSVRRSAWRGMVGVRFQRAALGNPRKPDEIGRIHRVPLSARAEKILETLAARTSGDVVFGGFKAGSSIGKTAMASERAYRRGDALLRRRELMDEWAAHCESECVVKMCTRSV